MILLVLLASWICYGQIRPHKEIYLSGTVSTNSEIPLGGLFKPLLPLVLDGSSHLEMFYLSKVAFENQTM